MAQRQQTTDPEKHTDSPNSGKRRRRIFKRLLMVGLLLAVLAGGVRLALLRGIIKPIRIAGASMAPALRGDCLRLECDDCGIVFYCDAENTPPEATAVCPNCGRRDNPLGQARLEQGQRVWIDRFPYLYRDPRRWELVAFKLPQRQEMLGVKRVVGLPGERIALRDGDLYIDDRIERKTLKQLRRMAVLVHDDRYRTTHPVPSTQSRRPPRWQADADDSLWQSTADGYLYEPKKDDQSDRWDWLSYRHVPCLPLPARRDVEKPVWDSYGYNQNVSRNLHETTDLLLVCPLQIDAGGQIALLIHNGRQAFRVELTNQQARLFQDDQLLAEAETGPLADRTIRWELAVCDRQVLLAADGKSLLAHPYQRSQQPLQPTSRPLAIAARSGAVRVGHPQIWRDLYYYHHLDLGLAGSTWQRGKPLAADEFFVLGDNGPVSQDSRHWSKTPLSRKLLLGKVLRLVRSSNRQ